MIDWNLIDKILFGNQPPVQVTVARSDDLYEASATRGTLVIGDPGVGKTRYVAMQIFKKWKAHHDQAIFVFDWSGSLTKTILDLISRDPHYTDLLKKVVLDDLGNEEYVIPKPEFHPAYGLTYEEQVSRVVGNFERLAEFMLAGAPFLAGVSIEEIGKQLFRLLTVIKNEHGENWQITEALELITDPKLLVEALKRFGQYNIPAKNYFLKQYLPKDVMTPHEKELTTRALRYLLGKIDSRVARATLGFYRPGWTPKEATDDGLLVLIDAHSMINQPAAQHYLLMQNFSHVMSWINRRETDDPLNKPAMIAFDETYTILKIKGMAEWLGMVSPLYRSRGISLLVIIQALWQLDENLREQIWTLGNCISFSVSNSDEATTIAQQLFSYDPKYVKNSPRTPFQNPTTEPVAGQDRIIADWIQNLKAREFIMRRYITEQQKEKGVVWVRRTTEYPTTPQLIEVSEIKRQLLRERGVRVRDALEVIAQRKLTTEKETSRRTID
jgi:hypothetical protein